MYQQSALLLGSSALFKASLLRLLDDPATRANLIALETAAPDDFSSPWAPNLGPEVAGSRL